METDVIETLVKLLDARPSASYRPGRDFDLDGNRIPEIDNGQLQFHKAPHVIRLLAPGNGWGKSATISVEAFWWADNSHPYRPEDIPERPRKIVWGCRTYHQWDIIRKDIEAWWTKDLVSSWVGSPRNCYTHANGSTIHIITAETDPGDIQGIQPDLVCADETFPVEVWRELVKRRRGKVRTRFAIAATQTEGLNWMYHDLYLPWKKFHEQQGVTDEREMMRQQLHRFEQPELAHLPGIWVCPQGSHRDNPTATKETFAFYLATTSGHPAERHVRLFGGWRDFSGNPVFEPSQLERMRLLLREGSTGRISLCA